VGLLEDLSAPQDLGVHALAKCLVGFAIGKLWAEQRIFKDNLRAQTLTLFLAGVGHDLIVFTFISRADALQFLSLFFRVGLPTAIYTAIFCPLLVTAWSWLRAKGPRLHERIFRIN
jgi:rod shape-determining protein MreD